MYESKYVLSFDCADKTLGVCLLSYLPSDIINERIELIKGENTIKQASQTIELIKNVLTVRSYWLFNLLPDLVVRDTEDAIRLSRLKYALKSIRNILDNANIRLNNVIVEYQMGQNDLSRLISAAIQYEFVDTDSNIQVTIGLLSDEKKYILSNQYEKNIQANSCISIGPSYKNSFSFSKDLTYGTFAAKYKTTTTANKHHTAENFKYFLSIHGFNIKALHKEINHIADAFMQAVWWIINHDFP